MPFSTRKAALAAAAAFGLLALAACGGGGGGGGTPQTSRVTLPEGHSVVSGSFTVAAGRSVDRGGVRFSCAAGGAACAVTADGGSGVARVTGGRLTVARVPAATPQPASVTLPQGHSVAAGSFSVAAGRSVDRGGVRFSCAAGGAACAVTVDGGSGTARFTGGRLTVARVPAATPTPQPGDGGQDGGMEETDWPFPDWPIADITSGGGTLSWSPSEIENRIRAFEDGDTVFEDALGEGLALNCATTILSNPSSCNVKYRPVMTHLHGGIPIVQARALDSSIFAYGADERPGEEIGVGGILDRGYFMAVWRKTGIGLDSESEEFGAATYLYSHDDSTDVVSIGRWRGALIGTGNSATSPLYRQFIIGNVDVTVQFASSSYREIDISFSGIRNLSTGDRNVTLSHMQWNFYRVVGKSTTSNLVTYGRQTPGRMNVDFRGPNDEEAFGSFYTEEAVGGFGAKKQ